MTEQTPDTVTAAHQADPGASTPASPASAPAKRSSRGIGFAGVALIVVLLVAIGLGWALWTQRKQADMAGREIAGRLASLEDAVAQGRKEARDALSLSQGHTNQLRTLEAKTQAAQTRYNDLQQAWETFSGAATDEILANDVERLLVLASQQLRLAGNVNNAIVALETAQARLAQAARPQFSGLQQSINGDIERLRAVATVDIPAQSARIERLVTLVSKAPLLVPDAAAPGASSETQPAPAKAPVTTIAQDPREQLPADAAWWERWRAEIASWPARAGGALANELGDLISVQRVDQPAALMLSGDQAEQVRGTLRQRLMTAQLALMMRQPEVWKNELENVQNVLSIYYDGRAVDTQAALRLTHELLNTDIAVRLPDVSDSLASVAALRADGFGASAKQD
ncbi:uroporphyrinogen-III C-methyltransferase [Bordetella sp. 15P40C-2]|uniref:uroporphyrinogen-III C-methyltransferase n=1 Tax=Bordetella sp. 15P40C-2 TaxID=2572246 RepID=UPI001320940E|nr:uroporphyrinogen-III C-methyltransferase [Bordetella sp. 15P40C-2]MVW72179.1 heme biosynthesis operon protein HemX [Bordetella sp. 15P40C-2]